MTSTRRVLLARPHAFIVDQMKPFLADAGFAPEAANTLAEVGARSAATRGAIISTAVVSSVAADAATVFAELRRASPRLPVLFAGLTDLDMMKAAVLRIVRPLHPDAEVVGIDEAEQARLGSANVFVVLRKEDLAPGKVDTAISVLQRHFA